MTGETVMHYRIGERLGAGGMGEVFLAEDTRLGRPVALKFLPSSYQYDPDRRERFLTEARAASALRSPYIAAIYDIGEHQGATFIVMEYVEGELLSHKLVRGPLPIFEAIDVATQVADALDEAHSLGIVHRDVKSTNLMITERGLVKVLDFGLAKVTTSGPLALGGMNESDSDATAHLGRETAVGLVLGTVSYMSPEQALGRQTDHRSDLFSLSVVTYEMLTGRLPFAGDSGTEIINKIVNEEPPAIARFNYSVPHELERIIRKAMEKNPEFRYQSARELYIDLRNLKRDLDVDRRTSNMSSIPTEHNPTVMLTESRPLAGGAGTRLESAVAVMTFSNITKEPADDWIGSGIAETVTADLKSIRGISVIGRERIFEVLKNINSGHLHEVDEGVAIDIGRRLGASWIIAGGYQRIGEMIRITARFIDVESGTLLKTVKIDGRITEIFDLQDKIVYELSQGLNLQLGTSEITAIERDETESVEAYENFSRGMMNLRTGSRDSLDRAIYFFEKARDLDPNYASAWTGLSVTYDLKGQFLGIPELSDRAVEFAQTAIGLNPVLPMAYQALGAAYNSIGRFDEAIGALKQALRIDPNSAGVHSTLGRAYWIGKGMIDEGIAELEQAIAINPQAGYAYLQLAFLHTIRGNYQRAEQVARQAIELQERRISGKEGLQIVGAHTRLGYVFYHLGRYDDAIAEYEQELDFLSSSDHALRDRTLIELEQKLGAAHLRKGDREKAEQYFKRALKQFEERVRRGSNESSTKYYVACIHALMGDKDSAIKHLEESITDMRKLNALRARTDPDFESLRDDPRFGALTSTQELARHQG